MRNLYSKSVSVVMLLLLGVFSQVQAQNREVSGTVTSVESSDGLPGVNVVEKGTTNGTITGVDGTFKLQIGENAILAFSSVGYVSEEVIVGSQSVIDLSLTPDITELQELVVIGYGTQEKSDITGAISTVTGEEITKVPVASFEQALAGRAAGVQVTAGSGIPGSGASIRIRGVGTVNNNEPLYVIDGIILGNVDGGGQDDISPLSLINPNDIQSIDILKDASATAIYGARAGNGVVIITTKKGKGKTSFNFDSYYGVSRMNNNIEMLSGPQWAAYYDNLRTISNQPDYAGKEFVQSVINGTEYDQYDWLDAATRDGIIQNYELSLNSGNETSQYYSSISYFDQTGVFINSDLERFTFRLNTDHKVGKKFKFGNVLTLARSAANTVGNLNAQNNTRDYLRRAQIANPYKAIYDSEGNYAGVEDFYNPQLDHSNEHIMWDLNELYRKQYRNKLWASIYGDFEIINGLNFRSMVSMDWSYNKNENRTPMQTGIEGNAVSDPTNNSLSFSNSESRTWFIENTLTYNKTIARDHKLTALAGYQAQNNLYTGFGVGDSRFVDTDYWFFSRPQQMTDIVDSEGNVITSQPITFPNASNSQVESAIVSLFGRAIYSFKDRYLFTATVRRDASSRFGSENRWGTFPAVNVGWRISEEDFMQSLTPISNMKLRAGYGISGSDNTGNYQYQSSVGTGDDYTYVFNEGRVEGANIRRLANQFLQWEQIKMLNVGMDFAFFENRLELTLDWFKKNTENLFLSFAPPLEAGTEQNPSGNLGEVQNTGFEMDLRGDVLTGPLSWNAGINFSIVKNEVISLAADGTDRYNGQNITRVGEEIGALYGYVMDGIFQNWDEVYSHAYQNQATSGDFNDDGTPIYDDTNREQVTTLNFTSPGDIRYKDINGDGIIEGENDRALIGSTVPDFIWGFNNELSFKGISLSVFLQGVHGVDVYNGLRIVGERSLDGWSNVRASTLNAWSGEGSTNEYHRHILGDPNANERTSSRWVEDGSFIRLRNIRLAYNFPKNLANSIGLQNVQLYLNGTNLVTITKYSGFDPEIGLRNGNNPETAGVDNGSYPISRQYTAGLRLSF